MQNYPKSLELNDGKRVMLRLAAREDFEYSLGFFRRQPESDRVYLQRDVTKRTVLESRFIEIEEGAQVTIIALADGMIVGDASLYVPLRGWFRKTGDMRIVVDTAYRGKGLGTLLTKEIIALAREKGLYKIAATYMETQRGLEKTLDRLGFEKEGVLKDIVIDLKGDEHDLILLGLRL
jgi:L-amino acid N-acyltransferase YncA